MWRDFWAGFRNMTDGAFGAGLVLILLPGVALYFGIVPIRSNSIVGLPLLAIFGIMMLFGALSLVAAVFEKLDLSDKTQALALPDGSIRAVIALALIVLFAIISIMLYLSLSEPYDIPAVSQAGRDAIVKESINRVVAIVPEKCAAPAATASTPSEAASGTANAASSVATPAAAASGATAGQADLDSSSPDCSVENKRYKVVVRTPPGQETTDLAKQLLILVGTLMTSVTSFYFASRSNPAPSADGAASGKGALTITKVTPPDIVLKDGASFDITIEGSGLDAVEDLELRQVAGPATLTLGKLVVTPTRIVGTFTAGSSITDGSYAVTMVDATGMRSSPKGSITVHRAA